MRQREFWTASIFFFWLRHGVVNENKKKNRRKELGGRVNVIL